MSEQTETGGGVFEPPKTGEISEPKPFKTLLPRVFERIETYETAGAALPAFPQGSQYLTR